MTRDKLIDGFLAKSGWAQATRSALAGDASNRRYERLKTTQNQSAVLMDAPPEKGEDVRPFVAIANYLVSIGLSAPRIIAADEVNGFLLLEDLGDALFARVVVDQPELEQTLYHSAVDVLLALHSKKAPSELKTYDIHIMSEMAALAHRWYASEGDTHSGIEKFKAVFAEAMNEHIADLSVLIQRDYHAENLLWLPDRVGAARVGLLDFQDAMLGHPAYDLVSLLQDARRDVPLEIEDAMIDQYVSARRICKETFRAAYAVLGVQRNMRILGVFGRLSLHANKPHYIDYIPRVWAYLQRDLEHPATASIRDTIVNDIPAPTPERLARLKEKCGTIPTL